MEMAIDSNFTRSSDSPYSATQLPHIAHRNTYENNHLDAHDEGASKRQKVSSDSQYVVPLSSHAALPIPVSVPVPVVPVPVSSSQYSASVIPLLAHSPTEPHTHKRRNKSARGKKHQRYYNSCHICKCAITPNLEFARCSCGVLYCNRQRCLSRLDTNFVDFRRALAQGAGCPHCDLNRNECPNSNCQAKKRNNRKSRPYHVSSAAGEDVEGKGVVDEEEEDEDGQESSISPEANTEAQQACDDTGKTSMTYSMNRVAQEESSSSSSPAAIRFPEDRRQPRSVELSTSRPFTSPPMFLHGALPNSTVLQKHNAVGAPSQSSTPNPLQMMLHRVSNPSAAAAEAANALEAQASHVSQRVAHTSVHSLLPSNLSLPFMPNSRISLPTNVSRNVAAASQLDLPISLQNFLRESADSLVAALPYYVPNYNEHELYRFMMSHLALSESVCSHLLLAKLTGIDFLYLTAYDLTTSFGLHPIEHANEIQLIATAAKSLQHHYSMCLSQGRLAMTQLNYNASLINSQNSPQSNAGNANQANIAPNNAIFHSAPSYSEGTGPRDQFSFGSRNFVQDNVSHSAKQQNRASGIKLVDSSSINTQLQSPSTDTALGSIANQPSTLGVTNRAVNLLQHSPCSLYLQFD